MLLLTVDMLGKQTESIITNSLFAWIFIVPWYIW